MQELDHGCEVWFSKQDIVETLGSGVVIHSDFAVNVPFDVNREQDVDS